MILSKLTNRIAYRRQAFRLALCIAMSASTGLTLADSGYEATAEQVSNSELPVYPFPPAPTATVAGQSTNKKAILRLLGFTDSNKIRSNTNAMAPAASIPTSVSVEGVGFTSLPGLPMQTASLPPADLQVTALGTAPALSMNSTVVVANAMRPAQSVQENISDKSKSDVASMESPDLLSSLDDLMSDADRTSGRPLTSSAQPQAMGFTDSIQIEYPSESDESSDTSGISMNMSDRDEPESDASGKAPELINTRQPMALHTESVRAIAEELSSRGTAIAQRVAQVQEPLPLASLPGLDRLPQRLQPGPELTAPAASHSKAEPVFAPTESEMPQELSSRREVRPEPMKIRIEGEPVPTHVQPRQPLVPMLVSATGRPNVPEQIPAIPASVPQNLSQLPTSQPSLGSSRPTPAASKEISVMVKDSLAMQSTETIQALSVEHEDICQVIRTGGKSYSLIGLRPGETRVAVITEVAGQRNVQIHQVVVSANQSTPHSGGSIASDLLQTIQQLYPRSKVRITSRGSQLVVGGSVDSEETAKKILSLVRKTTLTPVVDELQTR